MHRIVVASENPVKLRAVSQGFRAVFDSESFALTTISVASEVRDQPMSDTETRIGAETRARAARAAVPGANFWVGIEGGVEETSHGMLAFAWIVILSNDRAGYGRTGTFVLPEAVATLIRQGQELGDADDNVFGRRNSKQENGAVGLLTGNVIDRAGLYTQAVILALIPVLNPTLYPPTSVIHEDQP